MRIGFLLGLFLLFQALSEFIFASFLIIFTIIYLIYWLIVNRRRLSSLISRLVALVVAALTFTIPMLPILAAMVRDTLAEGDFIQSGLGFADVFSTDVLGLLVPSQLHPLFGGLAAQFHFAYTNFAYLGFAALALALIAVWKIPQARLWGLLGVIFVLISLGPNLQVNGNILPAPFLPFNWLLEIPLIKGNRYPSRWSVMVTLALAVLVGYGLAWTSQKFKVQRHKLGLVVPFAFLLVTCLEHLSIPLPLSNFQIPAVYQTIAADRSDFAVLEIPLAWRNGFRMTGTLDAEMMFEQWYQTEHQHPILGGNTSRNPELKFQYFAETPVLQSLIAVETGHALDEATIQRDRQLAPEVLRFFGIRYVIWHSPRNADNRAALEAARQYAERVFSMTKFYDTVDDTGQTIAYRVDPNAAGEAGPIRPDAPLARLSFAEGWGTLGGTEAWATRHEAKIFWRMDRARDAAVSLWARAPMAGQMLSVEVNGHAAGTVEMQAGWKDYDLPVPSTDWRAGMNEITLRFRALVPLPAAGEGGWPVGKTGVNAPVSIVARSAGSETGDFGHVFVDGIDQSPNGRGYNLVVVDPQSGTVLARDSFDTFASADESARLADFVEKIPAGRIVAAVVRDEASRYLTARAADALGTIGASVDLRSKWRWSHALIGVKGAQPGTALESASETAPSQLVVGIGGMEPGVAAAVEQIEIK